MATRVMKGIKFLNSLNNFCRASPKEIPDKFHPDWPYSLGGEDV